MERSERARSLRFIQTLYDVLSNRFPEQVPRAFPQEETIDEAADRLWTCLGNLTLADQPRLIVIDGIDHIVRAAPNAATIFEALRRTPPTGLVFVLFGQPDWHYPAWVDNAEHLSVPPFSQDETRRYVCGRLGWRPDPNTDAVADALHHRTNANPLSLFYNVGNLEANAHTPPEAIRALDQIRLFGGTPRNEYQTLLEDVSGLLPIPPGQRSLIKELLAYLATATYGLTPERLQLAFPDDFKNPRNALEILLALRPVILADEEDSYWVFHDDFRRYAEENVDSDLHRQAHRRHAATLSTEDEFESLGQVAEHLWLGGQFGELAELPSKHNLADWLLKASDESVIAAHKYGVAAAFEVEDIPTAVNNALLAHMAGQAVDYDGENATNSLSDLLYTVPIDATDFRGMEQRTEALRNLSHLTGAVDASVAADIAQRFMIEPNELPTDRRLQDHEVPRYIAALTEWHVTQENFDKLEPLLAKDAPYQRAAIDEIASWLENTNDDNRATLCADAFVGPSVALDNAVAEAAFGILGRGEQSQARRLADIVLQRSGSSSALRDAATIRHIVTRRNPPARSHCVCTVYGAGFSGLDAQEFRSLFCCAFCVAATGAEVAPTATSGADQFISELTGKTAATALRVWQLGTLCGLSIRNPLTTSKSDLQEIVSFFLPRENLTPSEHNYSLSQCAALFLPIAARILSIDEAQRGALAALLYPHVERIAKGTFTGKTEILEGLWACAPEKWRELASVAFGIRELPHTEGLERFEWFQYWASNGRERNRPPSPAFVAKALVSRVGVARKTDPASAAVAAFNASAKSPDLAQRASRLVNALIQLSDEPEGGRHINMHFCNVFAILLRHRPSAFQLQYERCSSDGAIEAFDSLPSMICKTTLEEDGATAQNLKLLWAWTAASPGSFDRENDGPWVCKRVSEELESHGDTEQAELVRDWGQCYALPPDKDERDEVENKTEPKALEPEAEEPTLEGFEITWLAAWWSREQHQRLRRFLEARGTKGWTALSKAIAKKVPQETMTPDVCFMIADGIIDLRPPESLEELFDLAVRFLERKVDFQKHPGPASNTEGSLSREEALLRLIACGIDVADAETIQRTVRVLAWLAKDPNLGPIVESEARQRIQAEDDRTVAYALLVLRHRPHLRQETTDTLTELIDHPNAICRWHARTLLKLEPAWEPMRSISLAHRAVVATPSPDRKHAGNHYFNNKASVREIFTKKIASVTAIPADTIRTALDDELDALPRIASRPIGWRRSKGHGLTTHRMGTAAGRLACRLLSTIDADAAPWLLSAVFPYDPWLIATRPQVKPPNGFVEVSSSQTRISDGTDETTLEFLGLMRGSDFAQIPSFAQSQFCEKWFTVFVADVPSDPAWVADEWTELRRPYFSESPIFALAFLNRPFGAHARSTFSTLPNWGLRAFRGLTYSLHPSPSWRQGNITRVAVSFSEWNEDREPTINLPRISWRTAWSFEGAWLKETFLRDSLVGVRFKRTERGKEDSNADVSYSMEQLDI